MEGKMRQQATDRGTIRDSATKKCVGAIDISVRKKKIGKRSS